METAIEAQVDPQPLFKKRGAKNIRKRPATPPPAQDSDESGYTSTEDEGRRVKRRRKTAIVNVSSNTKNNTTATIDLSTTKFTADRTAQITETNDATKTSNWFDDKSSVPDAKRLLGTTRALPSGQDATATGNDGTYKGPSNWYDEKGALNPKSLLGTTRARPSTTADATATGNDGTYKGASAYQSFIAKNPDAPSRAVGPVKAPTNIRTITVTDFAPDVCKDYKQTGFCGFGDSCKFLHAREDYKQGWELDRDWEIGGKDKKKGKAGGGTAKDLADAQDSEEEDAALEGIPFACIICKKPYTYPIVTKCGHYFCEKCALQRYRKNPNCAACGAGTGGVFNGAKSLKKILERKRERARKRREKAKEAGEEVSEDEENAEEANEA